MISNHTYDYDGGVITHTKSSSNKKYINNESKDVNNNNVSTFNGILEIKTSSSLLKSNTHRNKLSLNKRSSNNKNNQLLNLSTG